MTWFNRMLLAFAAFCISIIAVSNNGNSADAEKPEVIERSMRPAGRVSFITSQYPLTAVIDSFDTENDMVYAVDYNGNAWVFYGIEDWEIGDVVSMMMTDMGTTDSIYDDEVITVRYSGRASWD